MKNVMNKYNPLANGVGISSDSPKNNLGLF